MGNAIPISGGRTPDFQVDVQHFSIGSKWLYEEDSRFDAKNYSEGAFQVLDEIESCSFPKDLFGNLCGTIWHPVQNQARSNFKRIYTKPEHGVPFVSSRNMFFLPQRPEKFLSRRMPKLNDLIVPENWILISRSGTVGNVLLINKTLAKCAITDHAIRIEPIKAPSGYLYAFLASRFGQALIAKGTYGSTVDEIEPKHLAAIPVPLLPNAVQLSIHNKIIKAYALRDEANELFEKADTALHKLLGVSPFVEDDIEYLSNENEPRAFGVSSVDIINNSCFDNIDVRLDSKHHVPIVRSIIHKLEKGNYSFWIGSDDLIRVNPSSFYDPGFLAAFFLTPFARHQILAQVYGGVIDHVDETHIADVLCPKVPRKEQEQIGILIQKAFEKRDEANDQEDEAIAELENFISGSINK